jgi:hypothetical protein
MPIQSHPQAVPPSSRPAARLQEVSRPDTALRVCPDCAGPIVRSSGCLSCTQCGWGQCG